jgi:hypothetical protein
VAESGILTNPQINDTALNQVLKSNLEDVMSVVEWKKAEEKY